MFAHYLHYEAEPGRWEDVDLRFRPDGPDHVMDHHDVIVRVTEAGVHARERSSRKGVRWLTPGRPAVTGHSARFGDQGLDWEYTPTKSGIKLTAVVERRRGPRTYDFRYQLTGGATDFTLGPNGELVGDGFSVPPAVAIGADDVVYDAGSWRLRPGNEVAFHFDDSSLPREALPYELDPTTEFTAGTGWSAGGMAERNGPSYPPPYEAAWWQGQRIEASRSFNYPSGGNYNVRVAVLRWDTSALPENASISGAVFRPTTDKVNSESRSLTADWYAGPLDATAYTATAGTNALAGYPIASMMWTNWYQDIALDNAAGVSTTGYTGLRFHVSGGQPSGQNTVEFFTGSGNEPQLLVTYAVPPTINYASDSPDPVGAGSPVTFNVGWSDPDDSVKAVICKTNSISSGSCPGGSFATGGLSSTSPSSATYMTSTADIGTTSYYAFACDSANTCSSSVSGTFTVNTTVPAIISASDSPDPVAAGSQVAFEVGWSDPGDSVRAVICRTNSISSGSCPGGSFATGALKATSPSSATYTTSVSELGTRTYYAFACDSSNQCSSSLSGTLTVQNGPPTLSSASDSPDPVRVGSPVTFTAAWSDPNAGDSVRAVICRTNSISSGGCPGGSWASGSLSSTSPSSASYTATTPDIGTRSYYAFVCDQANACSSSVSGTFQVLAENRPPVVSFNVSPTVGERTTTVFNASLAGTTDPDDDPMTYRITWGDGHVDWSRDASHRYRTAGTYTVSGQACDSSGACSTGQQTVTVEFSNQPPTANLTVSPTIGDTQTTFTATVSGSDPDGDSLSYEIDWGDGATTVGRNGTHQYETPGRYTISGVVTDAYGGSGSATRDVVVCAVYQQGQCVERPPRQDPPVPNLPRELAAPAAEIVRTVPEAKDLAPSAPNDVLILDANLQQVYAEDNPDYREECTAGADTVCDAPGRLNRFVKRIVNLVGKSGGDGTGNVAPDVILLQEVALSHATRIAGKLTTKLGFRYRALIGSESAMVADSPEVDDWCLRNHPADQAECKRIIKIKSDTAIIYNNAVLNPTTTSYYDTKYDPDERCDRIGGQDVDGDDDGDPDCLWAKWKRHYFAGFDEHRVGRPNRVTGYTFAVASVHLVTVSHFKDDDQENESNLRHEQKKTEWVGEIADELALDYPLLDSHFIGGDLNVHRCRNKARLAAGDYPGDQPACEVRGWWTALSTRGFVDAILDRHQDDDDSRDRIEGQYRDGKSGTTQTFRRKRIDYLFGSSSSIRRASYDLTCGEGATGKIDKNCRDVRNADFYSDHRLLWTLARDS